MNSVAESSSVVVKVKEMVNLAIGCPEVGFVDFAMLKAVLQLLAQQLCVNEKYVYVEKVSPRVNSFVQGAKAKDSLIHISEVEISLPDLTQDTLDRASEIKKAMISQKTPTQSSVAVKMESPKGKDLKSKEQAAKTKMAVTAKQDKTQAGKTSKENVIIVKRTPPESETVESRSPRSPHSPLQRQISREHSPDSMGTVPDGTQSVPAGMLVQQMADGTVQQIPGMMQQVVPGGMLVQPGQPMMQQMPYAGMQQISPGGMVVQQMPDGTVQQVPAQAMMQYAGMQPAGAMQQYQGQAMTGLQQGGVVIQQMPDGTMQQTMIPGQAMPYPGMQQLAPGQVMPYSGMQQLAPGGNVFPGQTIPELMPDGTIVQQVIPQAPSPQQILVPTDVMSGMQEAACVMVPSDERTTPYVVVPNEMLATDDLRSLQPVSPAARGVLMSQERIGQAADYGRLVEDSKPYIMVPIGMLSSEQLNKMSGSGTRELSEGIACILLPYAMLADPEAMGRAVQQLQNGELPLGSTSYKLVPLNAVGDERMAELVEAGRENQLLSCSPTGGQQLQQQSLQYATIQQHKHLAKKVKALSDALTNAGMAVADVGPHEAYMPLDEQLPKRSSASQMWSQTNVDSRLQAIEACIDQMTQVTQTLASDVLERSKSMMDARGKDAKDNQKNFINLRNELEALKDYLGLSHTPDSQDMSSRLDYLAQTLKQCCEQAMILDQVSKDAWSSMQQQINLLDCDLRNLITKTFGAEEIGANMRAFVSMFETVQEEMQVMNKLAAQLASEKEERQYYMDAMAQELAYLGESKMDRDDLMEAMADKADAYALQRKVSKDQFENACEELANMLDSLLHKLTKQESIWQRALDDIQREVENKLDRMELNPMKKFFREKLKHMKQSLDEMKKMKLQVEAAGSKKMLRDVNCISCDAKAVMRRDQITMPKLPPSLPTGRCLRPVLNTQLDRYHRRVMSQQKPDFEPIDRDDVTLKNRWCGGSHTKVRSPDRKSGQACGSFMRNWGPDVVPVSGDGEADGRMYCVKKENSHLAFPDDDNIDPTSYIKKNKPKAKPASCKCDE